MPPDAAMTSLPAPPHVAAPAHVPVVPHVPSLLAGVLLALLVAAAVSRLRAPAAHHRAHHAHHPRAARAHGHHRRHYAPLRWRGRRGGRPADARAHAVHEDHSHSPHASDDTAVNTGNVRASGWLRVCAPAPDAAAADTDAGSTASATQQTLLARWLYPQSAGSGSAAGAPAPLNVLAYAVLKTDGCLRLYSNESLAALLVTINVAEYTVALDPPDAPDNEVYLRENPILLERRNSPVSLGLPSQKQLQPHLSPLSPSQALASTPASPDKSTNALADGKQYPWLLLYASSFTSKEDFYLCLRHASVGYMPHSNISHDMATKALAQSPAKDDLFTNARDAMSRQQHEFVAHMRNLKRVLGVESEASEATSPADASGSAITPGKNYALHNTALENAAELSAVSMSSSGNGVSHEAGSLTTTAQVQAPVPPLPRQPPSSCAWLNAILARIHLATYNMPETRAMVQKKLARKVALASLPSFLTDVVVRDVHMGPHAPRFDNPQLVGVHDDGEVIVDVDITYDGGFTFVLAATASFAVSTMLPPLAVPLELHFTVRKLQGRAMLKIKPFTETNRVWLGFYPHAGPDDAPPLLDINIVPRVSISNRTLNLASLSIINSQLSSKINDVFYESAVLPNMDDYNFSASNGLGGIFLHEHLVACASATTAAKHANGLAAIAHMGLNSDDVSASEDDKSAETAKLGPPAALLNTQSLPPRLPASGLPERRPSSASAAIPASSLGQRPVTPAGIGVPLRPPHPPRSRSPAPTTSASAPSSPQISPHRLRTISSPLPQVGLSLISAAYNSRESSAEEHSTTSLIGAGSSESAASASLSASPPSLAASLASLHTLSGSETPPGVVLKTNVSIMRKRKPGGGGGGAV